MYSIKKEISLREIYNGVKKDNIKGLNVQGFSFRAEQGLQSIYCCLHTEAHNIDFFSKDAYNLKVVNFNKSIDLNNYRFVSLEMFTFNSHYKTILETMSKTKKEISFEVVLFNSCDLYKSLNLECHELYLIIDGTKKYLISKYVGKSNASDLIRI